MKDNGPKYSFREHDKSSSAIFWGGGIYNLQPNGHDGSHGVNISGIGVVIAVRGLLLNGLSVYGED